LPYHHCPPSSYLLVSRCRTCIHCGPRHPCKGVAANAASTLTALGPWPSFVAAPRSSACMHFWLKFASPQGSMRRTTMLAALLAVMVASSTAQVPMVLFQWSIDLEQGIFTMTFSRDVDLSSVNLDQISLVSLDPPAGPTAWPQTVCPSPREYSRSSGSSGSPPLPASASLPHHRAFAFDKLKHCHEDDRVGLVAGLQGQLPCRRG